MNKKPRRGSRRKAIPTLLAEKYSSHLTPKPSQKPDLPYKKSLEEC